MTDPSLSDAEIEAALALCEKATPGPWESKDAPHAPFDGIFRVLGPFFPSHIPGKTFDDRQWLCELRNWNNANFIAAARTGYPAVLRALQSARAEIAAIDPRCRENHCQMGVLLACCDAAEAEIAVKDAVIAEQARSLAGVREQFTMHLAHVGAWLSELAVFVGAISISEDTVKVGLATRLVRDRVEILASRAEAAESRIAELEAEIAERNSALRNFVLTSDRWIEKAHELEAQLAERMRERDESDAVVYMQFFDGEPYEDDPAYPEVERKRQAAIERHRSNAAGSHE